VLADEGASGNRLSVIGSVARHRQQNSQRMPNRSSRVRIFSVLGSQRRLESGEAVTAETSVGCPPFWFQGPSTTILGRAPTLKSAGKSETVASWRIPTDRFAVAHATGCHVLVGCQRQFGGLHSKRRGARVDVWLNEHHIDGFGLLIRPPNHSDYFHRASPAFIPVGPRFRACDTLYSWAVRPDQLSIGESQRIRVRLDSDVRWDIDYVGFQLAIRASKHRVFLCHSSQDKKLARLFADSLRNHGIGVWLDEAEMTGGESLLNKIAAAISSVRFVVALISQSSLASPWVQKELALAMHDEINGRRVKVLPIRLQSAAMPHFLRDKYFIDCPSTRALPKAAEELVTSVSV